MRMCCTAEPQPQNSHKQLEKLKFSHQAAAAAGDPVAKFCMQHAVDYSVKRSGSLGHFEQRS